MCKVTLFTQYYGKFLRFLPIIYQKRINFAENIHNYLITTRKQL